MKSPEKIIPIIAIIAVLALAVAGFSFYQYQKAQKEIGSLKSDPNVAQAKIQQENKKLIEKVSKLIELPTTEQPTIATVTDITKLKDEPFFARAKNGDKAIVYNIAQKIFLYRPSENKIIDVAPITVGPPPSSTQSATTNVSPTSAKELRFVLYNGAKISGLTYKFEPELTKTFSGAKVIERSDAKGNYKESLIIDLSGGNTSQTAQLATALKLKISPLPKEETKPTGADILIILGEDKSNL